MHQIVIGTAGHIDHGKTALVEALTGTNTDSLQQEKSRGITIDLGFAYLNDRITIVDVPGHQKFIRNMVAGASTIQLCVHSNIKKVYQTQNKNRINAKYY